MSGALSSPAKPPPWRGMPAPRRRLGFPPSASGLFPNEVPSARRGAAASEEIRPCIACCGAIRRRPGFPKNGPTSFSRRRRRYTSASQGWCANISAYSEDGSTIVGVYLWRSKADADAFYSPDWIAGVRSRWGVMPAKSEWYVPQVVESAEGRVITEKAPAMAEAV